MQENRELTANQAQWERRVYRAQWDRRGVGAQQVPLALRVSKAHKVFPVRWVLPVLRGPLGLPGLPAWRVNRASRDLRDPKVPAVNKGSKDHRVLKGQWDLLGQEGR